MYRFLEALIFFISANIILTTFNKQKINPKAQ